MVYFINNTKIVINLFYFRSKIYAADKYIGPNEKIDVSDCSVNEWIINNPSDGFQRIGKFTKNSNVYNQLVFMNDDKFTIEVSDDKNTFSLVNK